MSVFLPPGYAAQKLSESQRERERLKPHQSRPVSQSLTKSNFPRRAMSNPSAPNQVTDAITSVIHSVSLCDNMLGSPTLASSAI